MKNTLPTITPELPNFSTPPRGIANDLFQTTLARAMNPRKRANLIAVMKTLEMMRETKSRDYTIAAVARGVLALGYSGPKEQSIRNKEGKDYRDLISAFTKEYSEPKAKRIPLEDDLVASITDHRAAARVLMIINENRSLQRRIDILHTQYKQLAAIELTPQGVGPRVTAARPQFSDMEIGAVRKFLCRVEDVDCSFDTHTGALLHERHGLEIGPPGFQQALLKIVGGPGDHA